MKDSEVLRKAKEIIVSLKYSWICHAIDHATENEKQAKDLKRWIMKCLKDNLTYEGWLIDNHMKVYKTMSGDDFRQGRIQWLDWMIAQCEEAEAKEASNYNKYAVAA
jgi:hypothetical protein